jgi:hypothetical protein
MQPDSNRILLVEKTINPRQEVRHLTHQMTHQMTHDIALGPTGASIFKHDSNSAICICKKITTIDLPFLFAPKRHK